VSAGRRGPPARSTAGVAAPRPVNLPSLKSEAPARDPDSGNRAPAGWGKAAPAGGEAGGGAAAGAAPGWQPPGAGGAPTGAVSTTGLNAREFPSLGAAPPPVPAGGWPPAAGGASWDRGRPQHTPGLPGAKVGGWWRGGVGLGRRFRGRGARATLVSLL